MENFWHPIATSGDVVEQPRQFMLLGERIVAFRHDAGVSAFRDRCSHRGAALSGGRVENGRLSCPYHGWSYDRTGACVHIPSLPEGSAIPERARIVTYEAREAFGLIWVAMLDPAQPFPSWPADAWSKSDYRVFLVNQYLWNTSAERAVENAMDFSHFNFVHARYTELANGPVITPYEVERTDTGLSYAYEDGRIRREYLLHFPFVVHDRKKVIAASTGDTWSESAHGTRSGDETILSFIASPVDKKTTRLYLFMARNHSFHVDDRSYVEGFDTVAEQDRVVVESQRPEQVPLGLMEELHLRYPDAAAQLYRRMLRELAPAREPGA
jgi:phenylpropionate dioxygenase-like ring-hydroxylating dioxygenase large terminal subunit